MTNPTQTRASVAGTGDMVEMKPAMGWFAAALVGAGVCFVLYPALRPFSDETSLDGAVAFASPWWVVAHAVGILGFTLLALGMVGLYVRFQQQAPGRALWAVALSIVGAGLTLPYYGAEVFGLHAIGQFSTGRGDLDLFTTLTDSVRWGPGIWFIVVGLILLAAGAVVAASAAWAWGEGIDRWRGAPLALALLLYLPQFAGPQWIRVSHGVLMAIGCALLASTLVSRGRRQHADRVG